MFIHTGAFKIQQWYKSWRTREMNMSLLLLPLAVLLASVPYTNSRGGGAAAGGGSHAGACYGSGAN